MPKTITMKQFLRFLDEYPVKQAPMAAQFIVNQMAFEGMKRSRKEVRKRFVVRSAFVPNRISFVASRRTMELSQIKSVFGARKEIGWMAKQEKGWVDRPKGGSKLPVPTRAARTGRSISRKKRPIHQLKRLGAIRKPSRYRGKTKRQRITAMLQDMARRRDKRPAMVPWGRKPGIYVVRNVRRRAGKTRFNFRMVKLYDLRKHTQRVKPRPWMRPTVHWLAKREKRIAETAWKRFLSRIR